MHNYNREESIKTQPGLLYINRTQMFLLPSFKLYDSGFVEKIRSMVILSVAIEDDSLNLFEGEPYLYITIDPNGPFDITSNSYKDKSRHRANFIIFNQYIKKHKSYVHDYPFNGEKSDLQVFVLKFPDVVGNEIKALFLEGRYSELYSKTQVDQIIIRILKTKGDVEDINPIYRVLLKDSTYNKIFFNKVFKDFSVKISDERELDYPPLLINEVYNYKLEDKIIYKLLKETIDGGRAQRD